MGKCRKNRQKVLILALIFTVSIGLNGCTEGLSTAFSGFGTAVSDFASGTWDGVTQIWDGTTHLAGQVWDGTQGILGATGEIVVEGASAAWDVVSDPQTIGGAALGGLVGGGPGMIAGATLGAIGAATSESEEDAAAQQRGHEQVNPGPGETPQNNTSGTEFK